VPARVEEPQAGERRRVGGKRPASAAQGEMEGVEAGDPAVGREEIWPLDLLELLETGSEPLPVRVVGPTHRQVDRLPVEGF
jgi:hypothetical protein